MALTLKEKSDLATGQILLASNQLAFWMSQKLVDYAQDWHNSTRPINRIGGVYTDVEDADLEVILKKIDNFADEVLRIEALGNRGLYNSATRLMADIIGDSSATLAQIEGASEAQVESFLDDNIAQVFYRGAKLNRVQVVKLNS